MKDSKKMILTLLLGVIVSSSCAYAYNNTKQENPLQNKGSSIINSNNNIQGISQCSGCCGCNRKCIK